MILQSALGRSQCLRGQASVKHIHFHSVAEYIGYEAQVMNYGLSRKGLARSLTRAVYKVIDKLLNVSARNLVEP